MENNSVSITVDETTALKIIRFYKNYQKENSNQYVSFFAKDDILNIAVTLYKPKANKTTAACVFQGDNALEESQIWSNSIPLFDLTKTVPAKSKKISVNSTGQIGSDEVGTGDFFGPISVCAAYVSNDQEKELLELGITDSKKMSDQYILSIGPKLIKKFKYSQLLLKNEKYNEVHSSGINMNAIKARMHNRALLNLARQYPDASIYQDQFAIPTTYFSYLKNEPEVLKNIIFETKAESKYISVALASVIARYSFLQNMKSLGDHYGVEIPFGAGENVDEFAYKFAKKFGLDELKKITKGNFINLTRLEEKLEQK